MSVMYDIFLPPLYLLTSLNITSYALANVKKYHMHESSRNAFNRCVEHCDTAQAGLKYKARPSLDVATRWNSTAAIYEVFVV